MTMDDRNLVGCSAADSQPLREWLDGFERSWDEGKLRRQMRRLPPKGHPLRLEVLTGLVRLDLCQRLRQGLSARLESYVKLYPELGPLDRLNADLILAEFNMRKACGESVAVDEFLRRFPGQAETLRRRLTESPETGSHPSAPTRTSNPNLPPAPSGSLPEQFGRYRVLEKLGRGNMGTVYLVHDCRLNRRVALKVPYYTAEDRDDVLARFAREAQAAGTLHHPNICPLHDVGEQDSIPYLTMAYIEGRPLSKVLREDGAMRPARAVEIISRLAQALEHAHSRGVLHRDLKPSNIMLTPKGDPVIMDFGLARWVDQDVARLTKTGALVGTPAYMPPELVSADRQASGPASDIYSLGVILYELLTGQVPFQGPVASVLAAVLIETPKPLSARRRGIDPRLEVLCLRMLAKKPGDRPASMAEVVTALTGCLTPVVDRPPVRSNSPVRSQSHTLDGHSQSFFKKHPTGSLIAVLAGVAVALVATIVLWLVLWQNLRANRAEGAPPAAPGQTETLHADAGKVPPPPDPKVAQPASGAPAGNVDPSQTDPVVPLSSPSPRPKSGAAKNARPQQGAHSEPRTKTP
jgi:serine/threonine protein kinase